jgi:hypothetical protein
MRAREDAHAMATLARQPRPKVKFKPDEVVRVTGRAMARDPEAGISTDHKGALAQVHSTYVDREGARRMVCKTEDGLMRAIPQDSLRTADVGHQSFAVPAGSGLPRYLSCGMDRQFCGPWCDADGRRHCVDDHEANEAAAASAAHKE